MKTIEQIKSEMAREEQRLNRAREEQSKLQGQLEQINGEISQIDLEIRAAGIDPATLDRDLEEMRVRAEEALGQIQVNLGAIQR